jgi:hypothetical protein
VGTDSEDSELKLKISYLWSQFSKHIEDRFGLTPEHYPDLIKVVKGSDYTQALGGWFSDDTFNVTEEAVNDVIPLKGVVARVCMISALPREGICSECINDLSTEFARQVLEGPQEALWVQQWSIHSPKKKVGTILVYNPSISFPALYGLVGPLGLESIIQEIAAMPRHNVNLAFDDYLTFIETRFRRFSVNLSTTELKIIKNLLLNATCSYNELGKRSGISSEWVSRKISDLRRRFILRRFERVPFSKIGIRLYNLLLGSEGVADNTFSLLSSCPFLYSYRRVQTGYWSTLATLAVPDNHRSVRSISSFLKSLSDRGLDAALIEVVSSGTVNCFDFYDSRLGAWMIPWELLEIQIRRILEDHLASAFPRIDRPAQQTKLHLDHLDLQIMDCVRRGMSSVAKVRTNLRIGQETAATRLKRMRKMGLIVPTWELRNIGLNESVIVFTDDSETGESIAAWTQRLPKSIIAFDDDRRLTLTTMLPKGGGFGMTWALSTVPRITSIDILGPQIHGSWGFPTDLWDAYEQRWLSPESRVETWLGQLD